MQAQELMTLWQNLNNEASKIPEVGRLVLEVYYDCSWYIHNAYDETIGRGNDLQELIDFLKDGLNDYLYCR